MIQDSYFVIADSFLPYRNQAVEEYLLKNAGTNSCTLYLWQNRRTVVIGRNQNARSECRVDLLESDGGYLARRLSGGGAVFHDLGNVNFSFIAADPVYDTARQQGVIIEAARMLGIAAEVSGRNDITAYGRKFSGSAFMSSGIRHCHHGTVLVSTDMSDMSKYLNVPRDKLGGKGIRSVRSRVVNLSEINPGITTKRVTAALYGAFAREYGVTPQRIAVADFDCAEMNSLTYKFASHEWMLENEPDFVFRKKSRFPWGGAELCLKVTDGYVSGARFYTDALDTDFPAAVEKVMIGVAFSARSLCEAVQKLCVSKSWAKMSIDISSLLMEAD